MKKEAQNRKDTPVYSGFIKYFPLAMKEVARVSKIGNDQHNPGKDLFWDRSKSGDELDALSRHLLDAGKLDTDGQRHSAKVAWRAMASLQKELEAKKCYISGRMSDGGREKPTFIGFFEAEKEWVAKGYEVFNPASVESDANKSWEHYLARDLTWIIENRPMLFMLKGWEESQGARLEYEVALRLGLKIKYQ